MGTVRFSGLDDFAARSPYEAGRVTVAVQGAVVDELFARLTRLLQVMTPVGGVLSERDRHPGLMKRSWHGLARSANGRQAKITLATGLAGKAGAYPAIINAGRKRSKAAGSRAQLLEGFKKRRSGKAIRGRWLGSRQAPRGVTGPAWKIVKRQREQIIAAARRKAEASV